MREIKFRAWEKMRKIIIPYEKLKSFEMEWFVSPAYEFMQFTGLKDKNGKEIYEGDVVVHSYKSGNQSDSFVLKWGEQEHGWLPVCKPAEGGYEWDAQNDDDLEVIGNIYENPELLN